MKPWGLFYPFILPDVGECPNPTVDHALVQAAREFCARTSVWREWCDPFTAPGSQQRFDFDLPTQSELVAAKRCTINGKDIRVLGSSHLPPGWSRGSSVLREAALIHIDLDEYFLYPMPSTGDEVEIETAVKPTLNAAGVGDVVYEEFAETVAKGALYRLLSSPGKTYTNVGAAAMARAAFELGVSSAANKSFRTTAMSDRKVRKAVL